MGARLGARTLPKITREILLMIWKTFPYSHAFWSAVISLVVLALVYLDLELLAGAVFYGAREVYQWKIEG